MVTGAASGIGYALALALAAEGMRVAMVDIDADAVGAAAARVEAAAGSATFGIAVDVSQEEQVATLAARAVERFGPVHVLCNNAGVQLPGQAWGFTRAQWDWLLGVNLFGVINGIRAFLPSMLQSGQPGHVVNTASVGGLLAYPNIAMYTTSKFAVVGLSETLSHDLAAAGAPVGVSVLCPGPTVSALRENSERLRPGSGEDTPVPTVTHWQRMPAAEVAAQAVGAIRTNRFWVLTHPEYTELITRRAAGITTTDEVVAPPALDGR